MLAGLFALALPCAYLPPESNSFTQTQIHGEQRRACANVNWNNFLSGRGHQVESTQLRARQV